MLTETDIQNLLRAKASIYAGPQCCARAWAWHISDMERVLIGGGFGRHIDVEKAIEIGLLPDLPWERFAYLGNTSLQGAYLALTCREHRAQVGRDRRQDDLPGVERRQPLHGGFHLGAVPPPHRREPFPVGAGGRWRRSTRTRWAALMSLTLAVAGKGGTGKTTFSALTIKYLREIGLTPILAIDADPSSNLNMALGMELHETVGQIREDTRDQVTGGTFQSGISKPDWFQYQVEQCLVEGDDLDLLAMGRPEGPGCYCAANHMLRQAIDRLGDSYPSVVIDNEAGMEHISRQTTRDVDWLFIVSDPTQRGLAAAEHIVRLIDSLGTRIGQAGLMVNRVDGELPEALGARRRAGRPAAGHAAARSRHQPPGRGGPPLIDLGRFIEIYPAVQGHLGDCPDPQPRHLRSLRRKHADHRREHPHHLPAGEGGHRRPRHRTIQQAWPGSRWMRVPAFSISTSGRRRRTGSRSCAGWSRLCRRSSTCPCRSTPPTLRPSVQGWRCSSGQGMVNSTSAEPERLEKVPPVAAEHGADSSPS